MKEVTALLLCSSESHLDRSASVTLKIPVVRLDFLPFFVSSLLVVAPCFIFDYPSSPQGLPGKDGETGAAGPPGPAVRITVSFIPLCNAPPLIASPTLLTLHINKQIRYLPSPDSSCVAVVSKICPRC